MTLLDRLERRFGRYALSNVTLYLVLAQGFVYFAREIQGAGGANPAGSLELIPRLVLQGQVWRLFTYAFVPPNVHPIWLLIYLAAFYFFGSAVEQTWGAFRYNLYLLVGFAAVAAASFAEPLAPASGHLVKTSVFLAFATLLPTYRIMLYMVLPIEARWLAMVTWALYGYWFYVGGLSDRLMVAAALANYVLFFWRSAFSRVKQSHRKRRFESRVKKSAKVVHECGVCGLTSEMAPRVAFRYCSQCVGQRCYCPDHIRDHEHVVEAQMTNDE